MSFLLYHLEFIWSLLVIIFYLYLICSSLRYRRFLTLHVFSLNSYALPPLPADIFFLNINLHACASSRMRKGAKHEQISTRVKNEKSSENQSLTQFSISPLFNMAFKSKCDLSEFYLIDTFYSIALIDERN